MSAVKYQERYSGTGQKYFTVISCNCWGTQIHKYTHTHTHTHTHRHTHHTHTHTHTHTQQHHTLSHTHTHTQIAHPAFLLPASKWCLVNVESLNVNSEKMEDLL